MSSKPIHTIRLGSVKAAIWENEAGEGIRFNTTFVRVYRIKEDDRKAQDDGWRETQSFGRDHLPILAKVADLAHTWCYEQRQSQSPNAA